MRLCTESSNGYSMPMRLNGVQLGGVGFSAEERGVTPNRADAFRASTAWRYDEPVEYSDIPAPTMSAEELGPAQADASSGSPSAIDALLKMFFPASAPPPRARPPVGAANPFEAPSALPVIVATAGGLVIVGVIAYALRKKK
mgnify:CR=1 FL=1